MIRQLEGERNAYLSAIRGLENRLAREQMNIQAEITEDEQIVRNIEQRILQMKETMRGLT